MLGARIAAPFSRKISLFVQGRRSLLSRVEASLKGNEAPVIWFHCPSVGEFEQARPIIERYKSRGGTARILLTFFSPSGYELRKDYKYADWVFYLPMDSPRNSSAFLDIVKPDVAVFTKYDYWYFYLTGLRKRNIPTYIISAIYREEQPFFKGWGKLWRQMLRCFTAIYVQNEESKSLLLWGGYSNVVMAGDTRYCLGIICTKPCSGEVCTREKGICGRQYLAGG